MPEEREMTLEEKQQRVSDFKRAFESSPGRYNSVYEYLSKFCFKNQTTFFADSQSICNWQEGSRVVLLEIDKWLEFDLTKKE